MWIYNLLVCDATFKIILIFHSSPNVNASYIHFCFSLGQISTCLAYCFQVLHIIEQNVRTMTTSKAELGVLAGP